MRIIAMVAAAITIGCSCPRIRLATPRVVIDAHGLDYMEIPVTRADMNRIDSTMAVQNGVLPYKFRIVGE